MIERYVTDEQKDLRQEVVGLAEKLNEVIDVLSRQVKLVAPRQQIPGPAQHVGYLEMMTQRLATGPLATLLKEDESNDLAKAMKETLTKFQGAVQAYKASLVGTGGTKATLEV